MKLLKSSITNKLLRFTYNSWNFLDKALRKSFLKRIRVSGMVKLEIEELSFKMYSMWDDGIVDLLYFKDRKYSELSEIKLFKELSRHSQTIFDIGANTGLYTIVSKLSNPDAAVHSFEPYPVNMKRLEKNIGLNGLRDKVTLVRNAVGKEKGEIQFAVPESDQICDVLSADIEFTNRFYKKWISYKNVSVSQIALDDYVMQQNLQTLDLIKIDVENYELNVFKGGLQVLEKYSPVILVEIFVSQEKIDFYENYLKPLGYHCYLILEGGLIRVNSLVNNPECKNFIFSKKKSSMEYLSYSEMGRLMEEIK